MSALDKVVPTSLMEDYLMWLSPPGAAFYAQFRSVGPYELALNFLRLQPGTVPHFCNKMRFVLLKDKVTFQHDDILQEYF